MGKPAPVPRNLELPEQRWRGSTGGTSGRASKTQSRRKSSQGLSSSIVARARRRQNRRHCATKSKELAKFVLGKDERAAAAYLEALTKRYSFATLFTQLVAPAAHHLGELWNQDYCDFFDVTVGVGRLQSFMNQFESAGRLTGVDLQRRAVLLALPEEPHIFGLQMVGKFLEANGWTVSFAFGRTEDEIVKIVAEEWIGVVGVSLSAATRIGSAARIVQSAYRRDSRRRRVQQQA